MGSPGMALPAKPRKNLRSSVQRRASLTISLRGRSGPARMTFANSGWRRPPVHGSTSEGSDSAGVCLEEPAQLAVLRTARRLKPKL